VDFIADLHIHSPYSRATSKESTLAGLAAWARIKGIQLLGTGDFTHPGWFARLKEELVPAEPGLFRLKDEGAIPSPLPGVAPAPAQVRFLLSAEISSIYKRHGAVRKVHNILYLPDFASAERLNAKLAGIGNVESDGRPILGLDSRNLLEILLEQAPEGFLVPAHIWTPWFSLFGSRSGFDSIEECFGDLTDQVFALETGLSSDPAMNRLISGLDRFALISNSDCHSPGKLGREANLFRTDLSYFALRDALKRNRRDSFRGTVEFFPEEGKYHYDGHRKCHVCLDPHETRRLGLRCPVCGKPLTVGVHHRVMELADRETPLYGAEAPEFFSLIPLPEVLGELLGVGPASKEVMGRYSQAIARFGSEFHLLLQAPLEEISDYAPLLGEAIDRMRRGQVVRQPGYDGEFGVIRVFGEGELAQLAGQGNLFGDPKSRRGRQKKAAVGPLPAVRSADCPLAEEQRGPNPEQAAAITSRSRQLLVAAGPGTGKTYTLVARLAALLAEGAEPTRVCAITFTTKAAAQVRERLIKAVGPAGEEVFVGTFHRFCLDWLQRESPGLTVVGPESRERLLKRLLPELTASERTSLGEEIADFVERFGSGTSLPAPPDAVRRYFDELGRLTAIDLDGVIPTMVKRLQGDTDFRQRVVASVEQLFVDEFQDLNASQFALVQLLATAAGVFAIGDPDQAIYGFRGSDLAYFFRFAELPGTETLSLSRNYRSGKAIIAAAGAVISRNSRRSGLELQAQTARPGEIELYGAPTPAAEAEFVVRRIEELMGGIESFSLNSGRGGDDAGRGRSFGDFAVLVRLGKQLEEIAVALARRGIPFQRVGATPFFMGPLLRPAYYFCQAAAGSVVIGDWLNLLAALAGIGTATVERLEAQLPLVGDFFAALAGIELPAAPARIVAKLAQSMARFREQAAAVGLSAALAGVLELLGIDPAQADTTRLLELAGSFGRDLAAFGGHLRQSAIATVYDERAEAVALMTGHAAKGLEFPVVFLAGLEEGLFPCTLMGEVDLEEERRLFYVGLTRARERLLLSWAAVRPWAGPGPRQLSRFVGEIPGRYLGQAAAGPKRRPGKPDPGQLDLF
jgi:ATP-dependent DNA helicase UvrD/PcrA